MKAIKLQSEMKKNTKLGYLKEFNDIEKELVQISRGLAKIENELYSEYNFIYPDR